MCHGVVDCELSCMARLITQKDFPIRVLGQLMQKYWKVDKLGVAKIHMNVCQIFFSSESEMDKFLKKGPWSFDNKLLATRH